MKKWIFGSFVGAVIVFAWQSSSWTFLGIHKDSFKHHPDQENIISNLSSTFNEDSAYMIPNLKPGYSQKEYKEFMKQLEGKPWATIIYHSSYKDNMLSNMIRGFLVSFVLVLLLVIILTKGGLPNFYGFFTGSLAVGVFTFLWGPYSGHIWFDLPWHMIRGDIIDAIAAWGLCGAWLGWWMNKK